MLLFRFYFPRQPARDRGRQAHPATSLSKIHRHGKISKSELSATLAFRTKHETANNKPQLPLLDPVGVMANLWSWLSRRLVFFESGCGQVYLRLECRGVTPGSISCHRCSGSTKSPWPAAKQWRHLSFLSNLRGRFKDGRTKMVEQWWKTVWAGEHACSEAACMLPTQEEPQNVGHCP